MTVALIIVSSVAAATVVCLAVLASHLALRVRQLEHRAAAESLVGHTVVINTDAKTDDQTWKGIVHAQYADFWVLRDVVSVTGVGEQAVPHLVHVPVGKIASVQEIPG